jgi:hypothetical protein
MQSALSGRETCVDADASRLSSPSRHIYKSLTIVIAFRHLFAFDRIRQRSIKVDGTFV